MGLEFVTDCGNEDCEDNINGLCNNVVCPKLNTKFPHILCDNCGEDLTFGEVDNIRTICYDTVVLCKKCYFDRANYFIQTSDMPTFEELFREPKHIYGYDDDGEEYEIWLE